MKIAKKLNAPNNLLRIILRKEKLRPLPPPGSKNFVTNRDGQYPAKSPLGMFDNLYVPNDLGKIVNTMNAYYEGE